MAVGNGHALLAVVDVQGSVSWLSIFNTVLAGVLVTALVAIWRWVVAVQNRLDKLDGDIAESLKTHVELRSEIGNLWQQQLLQQLPRRQRTLLQLLRPPHSLLTLLHIMRRENK